MKVQTDHVEPPRRSSHAFHLAESMHFTTQRNMQPAKPSISIVHSTARTVAVNLNTIHAISYGATYFLRSKRCREKQMNQTTRVHLQSLPNVVDTSVFMRSEGLTIKRARLWIPPQVILIWFPSSQPNFNRFILILFSLLRFVLFY